MVIGVADSQYVSIENVLEQYGLYRRAQNSYCAPTRQDSSIDEGSASPARLHFVMVSTTRELYSVKKVECE